MEYRGLEYIKKPVSRIFCGTAGITKYNTETKLLLDSCLEYGVTAFDLARIYGLGDTEKVIGQWLSENGKREEVVLLSKCGHFDLRTRRSRVNRREMLIDLRDTLSALHTDYLDIYLLHRDDPETSIEEVVETFNEMLSKDKIRAFGGSNWSHRRIEKANEYAYKNNLRPFTVSSPYCGLAEQTTDVWGGGCVSVSGPANKAAREWYEKNEMPVVGYSSLACGFFSGKIRSNLPELIGSIMEEHAAEAYGTEDNFKRLARCEELAAQKQATVPQIALAWSLRQKMNTFAIVSASSPGRMKANVDALNIKLTEDECRYLNLNQD